MVAVALRGGGVAAVFGCCGEPGWWCDVAELRACDCEALDGGVMLACCGVPGCCWSLLGLESPLSEKS